MHVISENYLLKNEIVLTDPITCILGTVEETDDDAHIKFPGGLASECAILASCILSRGVNFGCRSSSSCSGGKDAETAATRTHDLPDVHDFL